MASRRRAEDLIVAGRVRVNGRVVRELGTSVTDTDRVEADGRLIEAAIERTYVVMNKPTGVMTTMSDPEGRRTVADVVKSAGIRARVVPVGRLDYDTSGVLLLTDDGEVANVLTHPRFGVEKTYRVGVRGRLSPEQVESLLSGMRLEDGRSAPAHVRVVAVRREISLVDLTLHEGRNRQVRRMFEKLGHEVYSLTRMRFGPLGIGELPVGGVRTLSPKERAEIERIVGLARDAKTEDALP